MAEKEDVRKFKEFLVECLEDKEKKLSVKEIPEEKKHKMAEKFRKLVGV